MAVDALVPTSDGAPGGFAGDDASRRRVAAGGAVAGRAHRPRSARPVLRSRGRGRGARRRNSGIKRALLDQTLVSGIGNIYADESLWAAELHPERPSSSLGEARIRRLFAEVRSVLEARWPRAAPASTRSTSM
ncbi:hypothetical protein Q0F99_19715 [Rathayibacter oskolensis]|uniref:hypothetical protein n=1 Tax=Rathayibacter oskolensis TaxID=1891671 RepID=UPI00265FD060|nr:hypothetical protein [Rathayibacter oskolensis]WKK71538.1 hypothetical protein Q0F99_19715 [Rathayibacter oskolensis]